MSDSKYSPPVNIPENVPGRPESPDQLIIQFLHSSGQWVGATGGQLMLKQVEENVIGLGIVVEGGTQFRSFIHFPGKLVLQEKTIIVP
jgi:hypothetical protein